MFCKSPLPARNSFGLLPQGYCERKTPKSYKSSVLSVLLLIYEDNFDKLWSVDCFLEMVTIVASAVENTKARNIIRNSIKPFLSKIYFLLNSSVCLV